MPIADGLHMGYLEEANNHVYPHICKNRINLAWVGGQDLERMLRIFSSGKKEENMLHKEFPFFLTRKKKSSKKLNWGIPSNASKTPSTAGDQATTRPRVRKTKSMVTLINKTPAPSLHAAKPYGGNPNQPPRSSRHLGGKQHGVRKERRRRADRSPSPAVARRQGG